MYRRPKFLEVLLEIRQRMALEADYDVDLFAEIARTGNRSARSTRRRASVEAAAETPKPRNTASPRRRIAKK
jgi:hypothetical protein